MKVLAKKEELCIACGACEDKCSSTYFKEKNKEKSRIRIENEKITVCNQCGVCTDICPVEALKRDKKGIVRVNKKDCVGCFMCVGFCPEEAMMEHEEYIEPFKCIACGLCAKVCPTNAIYIKETEENEAVEQTAVGKEN